MDPDYYAPLCRPPDEQDQSQEHEDVCVNRLHDERILALLEERQLSLTAKSETGAGAMPEQEAFLLQTQYLMGGQEYELTERQRKGYDEHSHVHAKSSKGKGKKRRRERSSKRRRRARSSSSEPAGFSGRGRRRHSVDWVSRSFVEVEVKRTLDRVSARRAAGASTRWARCGSRDTGSSSLREEEEAAVRARWTGLVCTDRTGADRWAAADTAQDATRFEWAAEFVPVQMDRKRMHFMLLPKALRLRSPVTIYSLLA